MEIKILKAISNLIKMSETKRRMEITFEEDIYNQLEEEVTHLRVDKELAPYVNLRDSELYGGRGRSGTCMELDISGVILIINSRLYQTQKVPKPTKINR